MTVITGDTKNIFIGLASDTRPDCAYGCRYYAYDTRVWYVNTPGGWVVDNSVGFTASVSLTRPNDTNNYGAGDVLGAATGSTAALEFANIGPNAGQIMLTTVELEIDVTSVPSGMTSFRLYLYSVTPPSALGDNAAWDLPSGDRASYLGYLDLGAPLDLGSTLYVQTTQVNKHVKLAGTSVFAYLVTIGAYTPTAQAVKKITLHAVAL